MLSSPNSFLQALFLVGFCAMIIDGNIASVEVTLNQSIYTEASINQQMDYTDMTNYHIDIVNSNAEEFLEGYFKALKENTPDEKQALSLLRIIDSVIKADKKIADNERRFLKLTQAQLGISNEKVRQRFPEMDSLFQSKEETNESVEQEISSFIKALELPKFDQLKK